MFGSLMFGMLGVETVTTAAAVHQGSRLAVLQNDVDDVVDHQALGDLVLAKSQEFHDEFFELVLL